VPALAQLQRTEILSVQVGEVDSCFKDQPPSLSRQHRTAAGQRDVAYIACTVIESQRGKVGVWYQTMFCTWKTLKNTGIGLARLGEVGLGQGLVSRLQWALTYLHIA
jgi:hypothetical protein